MSESFKSLVNELKNNIWNNIYRNIVVNTFYLDNMIISTMNIDCYMLMSTKLFLHASPSNISKCIQPLLGSLPGSRGVIPTLSWLPEQWSIILQIIVIIYVTTSVCLWCWLLLLTRTTTRSRQIKDVKI